MLLFFPLLVDTLDCHSDGVVGRALPVYKLSAGTPVPHMTLSMVSSKSPRLKKTWPQWFTGFGVAKALHTRVGSILSLDMFSMPVTNIGRCKWQTLRGDEAPILPRLAPVVVKQQHPRRQSAVAADVAEIGSDEEVDASQVDALFQVNSEVVSQAQPSCSQADMKPRSFKTVAKAHIMGVDDNFFSESDLSDGMTSPDSDLSDDVVVPKIAVRKPSSAAASAPKRPRVHPPPAEEPAAGSAPPEADLEAPPPSCAAAAGAPPPPPPGGPVAAPQATGGWEVVDCLPHGWLRVHREKRRIDAHCAYHRNCKMDRVASRAPIGLALLWMSRGRPGVAADKCIHDSHKLRCSLEQCFEDRQAARDIFKALAIEGDARACALAIERDARDDGADHELQSIKCSAADSSLAKLLIAQDAEAAEHLPFRW